MTESRRFFGSPQVPFRFSVFMDFEISYFRGKNPFLYGSPQVPFRFSVFMDFEFSYFQEKNPFLREKNPFLRKNKSVFT